MIKCTGLKNLNRKKKMVNLTLYITVIKKVCPKLFLQNSKIVSQISKIMVCCKYHQKNDGQISVFKIRKRHILKTLIDSSNINKYFPKFNIDTNLKTQMIVEYILEPNTL